MSEELKVITLTELGNKCDRLKRENKALQADNERKTKALDYDKYKLHQEITELLVTSQFSFWVEKEHSEPTAATLDGAKQIAINYYLGKTDNPKDFTPTEQVRFHAIVDAQVHLIMSSFAEALTQGKKNE